MAVSTRSEPQSRHLRAAMGKSVRLIALTGYGQPEDRERAFDAGFDMHLVKPVDRDQLSEASNGSAPGRGVDPAVLAGASNAGGNGDPRRTAM